MALSSNQRNNVVFVVAAGLTAIASAGYLSIAGISEEAIGVLLRSSARIAFVLLLVVFVARPLQQLLATPATAALLRNRRLIGIAFAGVHTVHLGLIIFRANQAPDFEFSLTASPLGALTYLIIYLMLITSYDRPAHTLGKKRWKILHKVGLYWLFAVFVQTQLPSSFDNLADANWWLITAIAAAIIIRLTAFFTKSPARPPPTRPRGAGD
jgi:DMSO/TMAO reductase YedYZ heme-binding membrane subunit